MSAYAIAARLPAWRRRLWSYIPLLALALEIPWFLICVLGLLFALGDTGKMSEQRGKALGIFLSIPVALGAVAGLYVFIFRRSGRVVDLIFLLLGLILCAIIAVRCIID